MSPRISIRLLASQSDQRLLALAREGQERAFEALVHRYRRPLLRYARRRMRLSDAQAEDVLQQALIRAWIALSRGAEVRDVRSWLYRIVHNLAVNAIRGPAESHGELTQAVQDRAGLAEASNIERSIAARDALCDVAALPRMQRQAIFLTAVDGQSHVQVADTLGITPGALRGLLYRARSTLRSAAAALTPQPLLELAARGGGATAPSAERVAELTAGGAGAAGLAGALLKGGLAVVTAGAIATGASDLASHRHRAAQSHRGAGAPSAASGGDAARVRTLGVVGASAPVGVARQVTRLVAEIDRRGHHGSDDLLRRRTARSRRLEGGGEDRLHGVGDRRGAGHDGDRSGRVSETPFLIGGAGVRGSGPSSGGSGDRLSRDRVTQSSMPLTGDGRDGSSQAADAANSGPSPDRSTTTSGAASTDGSSRSGDGLSSPDMSG
ncbi:MAG TPA: sigma-70 family RNA polymerase sigma factor [Solirubrobacteraceae bacterium]|nr:sigma-70 family RNA polymerase sigma factor [Solirubrobacteraceae bacterium]